MPMCIALGLCDLLEPVKGRGDARAGGLGLGAPLALLLDDVLGRLGGELGVTQLGIKLGDLAIELLDLPGEAARLLAHVDNVGQGQDEGRLADDDPGRDEFGIMRKCERILKGRGVNVYPSLIPSMQRLTERGIRLASHFRALGIPVIESYPGAAQDIMDIPRKRAGLEHLVTGLADFGLKGAFEKNGASHDELDAITSAIVGLFFWSGKFEA